jgi:hypothetical protein
LKLNPEFRSQNAGEEQTTMTVLVIAAIILDSGSWLLAPEFPGVNKY